MPSCFNDYYPLCVKCGELQPKIVPGQMSRHNCDRCGKAIEVYSNNDGMYQVACVEHNLRQMNGVPVCTLCGYEPDPGP